MAIVTKRVVQSLLVGIATAVVILLPSPAVQQANLGDAFTWSGYGMSTVAAFAANLLESHLWAELIEEDHLRVFAFTGLLGMQVALIHRMGGMLGIVAVATKHEFALVVIGGLFVIEALSVMLQVGWFKITKRLTGEGKRIFLMAPLHHHFQKKNWPETRVVARFWILSVLFALAGLATLKLR